MTSPSGTPLIASTGASATLRLGTRASALAMAQSDMIAAELRTRLGVPVELVTVRTEGDASTEPLAQIGGTGVFVSALRDALLRGEVDLAVHSLKDLPTTPADGIVLAATPGREDPRDALVARDRLTLGELPVGSRIGTGSPRRVAQLGSLGMGLECVALRGNVESRIRRVADGHLDGVVLARAGLARIGRLDEVTEVIDPLQMLPAPGQGALAVECRAQDTALHHDLAQLDNPDVRACITAERAVLAAVEAGCSAPLGALADVVEGDDGPELWLRAEVLSLDGALSVRNSCTGPVSDADGVGTRLAQQLLSDGAADLMHAPARKQQP